MLGLALLESARERGGSAAVVPFSWSGKNSVAARREAGTALARRLLELRREDPLRAIYVIAHSHGGSVFAYALKEEPGLADHIDGFIALATPWIAVQPCAYALALRTLLFSAVLYLSLLPTMAGAGRVSEWWVDYLIARRERRRVLLREGDPLAFAQGFGDLANDLGTYVGWYVLTGLAVGVAGYLLHRRLAHWLVYGAAEFERRTKVAADQASTLHERLPPSVFFKPIGDEAALAMAWTSGMASLMQAASQFLFYFLQSVRDSWLSIPRYGRIIGSVALILAWSVGTAALLVFTILADGTTTTAKLATTIRESFPPGFSSWGNFDIAYLVWELPIVFAVVAWTAILVAMAALVAVTLVAWLAAAGAGIPTLRAALFMRILVEASPLGNHELILVDVSAPQRQQRVAATALSHSSLYESPGVITAVLGAIHGFQSVRREKRTVPQ
jgi:hypothetical protein